jgi:hypothetical protein
MKGLVGILFGLFICAVIVFLAVWLEVYGFRPPTSGEHTGIVTATEKNTNFPFGWVTKIAYFKTSQYATQEDVYCVTNDTLFGQLQQYQQGQTTVTITFGNGWWDMPWWACGGGDTIINSVTIKS